MPLLHDRSALRALCDADDAAVCSWARARLALVYGEVAGFPSTLADAEPVLISGVPGAVDALVAALAAGDVSVETMSATEAVRACGQADDAVVAALRGVHPRDPEAALWRSLTLGRAGAPDPVGLGIACRVGAPLDGWPLQVAVLWASAHLGALDDTAAAVARHLDPKALWPAMHALGAAPLPASSRDPWENAAFGRLFAGRPGPVVRWGKGSMGRRLQETVQGLLGDVPGPAAALLRSYAASARIGPELGWLASTAGWLSAFAPSDDPVGDVLERGGASWPGLLTVARGAVQETDRDRVASALLEQSEAGVLALVILDEALADLIFERCARDPDLRTVAVGAVAGGRYPERLAARMARGVGPGLTAIAGFVPHEQVLEQLLATPEGPDVAGWAWALAFQGDPAAYAFLESVAGTTEDPDVHAARLFCGRLLGLDVGSDRDR